MSYSRWITSTFYTYWCVSDAKNKNDELFMCHTDIYKSYKFKYMECKRIVEDLTSIKGKINEIEGDEDATMNLVWNFAVESAMTDWGTLRIGYVKAHDFGGGANDGGALVMGLGFNYGSFSLDMNIGDSYDALLNDPVKWAAGRNTNALSSDWTISYNW